MANTNTAVGRIVHIYPAQKITEKFTKREFILETDLDTDYPQTILFQVTGNKCPLLDSFKPGDPVEVSFNLRGRIWEDKEKGRRRVLNTLEAWRISKPGQNAHPVAQVETATVLPESDDLSF